jgi:hypothetical protein
MFNNKYPALILSFLFVFAWTFNVMAQTKTYMPTANDVINKMKTDLLLTDKQAEQIKPAIDEDIRQISELMGNNQNTPEAARSAMECLHKETKLKLTQFLTEQQMEKLKNTKQTKGVVY